MVQECETWHLEGEKITIGGIKSSAEIAFKDCKDTPFKKSELEFFFRQAQASKFQRIIKTIKKQITDK